jgi:hypothetical protein
MKVSEVFKGDKGEFSSKRFVGIVGALVLFGSLVYYNTPQLVEAVEFITIFSLGYTVIDKYTNGKASTDSKAQDKA